MAQIFVRGCGGETLPVDVTADTTIAHIKGTLESTYGIPVCEQRLVYGSFSQLEDDFTLADYGIQQEATLFVVTGDLLGGGKKRKKKTYTKPKKPKHKKKKVKLAILKYYKVDNAGKVSRLRKECPAEICGSGIFFANHFDRFYCGKCGLTYKKDMEGGGQEAGGGEGGGGGKKGKKGKA
ncbi:unnamed protein product [Vitrella brassicaformis CCMP3155]|uniref:Ubiquitin-like domain-containing protein n=1 Tax=Vitrella brassicaformis (strain CCMP3155) TaxID=1169540 RepID=A0A0G4FXS4_VITBC|nr:unnamed protein product [Vitrella brassicaformis CCMP3155]|eukprot:CEM20222.1 unnamed protein product [Vitrella brassicaformis CCMP3155]